MRRLSAAAFGLWLTGLGSAFCCGPDARDIHARKGAEAARDESAAAPGGHCAARPGRVSGDADDAGVGANSIETTSRVMSGASSCCGRACRHPYAAPRLPPLNEVAFACALETISRSGGAAPGLSRTEARGRSPDGSATHVRCCVFRI